MRRQPLFVALLLSGCKVEPAPANVDELFHRLWGAFPVEAEIDVGALVASVPDIIDLDALEGELAKTAQKGSHTHLSAEEIADLPFADAQGKPTAPPDPALATPLFVIDRFACSADALEAILTFPDQNALYDNYESYERNFLAPPERYLDGTVDTLAWTGTIAVNAAIKYTYDFRTDLRRIPIDAELAVPGDTVWMVRNVLPRPADWQGKDGYFKQDYQLELFVPLAGGDMVHLYPVWRELQALSFTLDSDIGASINFGQTISFDEKTAKLCLDGVPTP